MLAVQEQTNCSASIIPRHLQQHLNPPRPHIRSLALARLAWRASPHWHHQRHCPRSACGRTGPWCPQQHLHAHTHTHTCSLPWVLPVLKPVMVICAGIDQYPHHELKEPQRQPSGSMTCLNGPTSWSSCCSLYCVLRLPWDVQKLKSLNDACANDTSRTRDYGL